MFIGICGGICAGKSSIALYLQKEQGFKRLRLARTAPTPDVEKSAAETTVPSGQNPDEDDDNLYFGEPEALISFVTANWREKWVTTDIWDQHVVEVFSRRPFFLLISVDAPVTVRWERFKKRCLSYNLPPPDLATFVSNNDAHVYSRNAGLAMLLHRARLQLLNDTTGLNHLHASLQALDLTSEDRIRPSWDQYFMRLADLAAQRSNCMKRLVGCVLVREKRVISTGYNGTPRGMTNCNEGGCHRCNAGERSGVRLDTCLCLHAEENALLEAGRERIREGSTLYCNTCPCLTCSVKISQVGISEVVYSNDYSVDSIAASIFKEAGVKLRQFSSRPLGLVDLSADINLPILHSEANSG